MCDVTAREKLHQEILEGCVKRLWGQENVPDAPVLECWQKNNWCFRYLNEIAESYVDAVSNSFTSLTQISQGMCVDYYAEKILEKFSGWMVGALQALSAPFDIRLIDAVSAERYESGQTDGLAVAIVIDKTVEQLGEMPEAHMLKCERKKGEEGYPGIPLQYKSYEKVRELRKALQFGRSPQCLLAAPMEPGGSLYVVGFGLRKHFCKRYPVIVFSGYAQWEFYLPGDVQRGSNLSEDTYLIRRRGGYFQLPMDGCVVGQFCKKIKNKIISIDSIEEKAKKSEDILGLRNKLLKIKQGASIVFFQTEAEAEAESKRLCELKRGYRLERPVSYDDLPNLISVDGAFLCNIEESKCVAFGVILDGVAEVEGRQSRGARFNSMSAYLSNRPRAFGIVFSEDGMLNLLPALEKVE